MRTLIVAPNWIGDALMAQPLLARLKRAHPDEPIIALAPAWVAPVLEAMPEVERVIPTTLAHGKLQWRERREFAARLRNSFTRAYVLPNSFKSALIPWLARIPQRIGYAGEIRYGLLTSALPNPPAAMPMAQRYAALAGQLPDALPNPRLVVDAAASAATRLKFGIRPEQRLIALCPGAEFGPAKRWPAQHFAELATLLAADDPGAAIVLLGGPGDRDSATHIRATTTVPVLDLTGSTTLTEAIALIAAADAVVSNDSGLMHVAAALARPQVAVFGSSDPRHTPPLSRYAEVVWLHLECSPCFARVCPLGPTRGHMRCLNDITAARVHDALRALT